MPATQTHIKLNIDKIEKGKDAELQTLLRKARSDADTALGKLFVGEDSGLDEHLQEYYAAPEEETPEQAKTRQQLASDQLTWKMFVEAANKRKIADRIPGNVGKKFAKKYGTLAARPPRGALNEFTLTPTALAAIKANATFTTEGLYEVNGEKGAVSADGVFSFRNRRKAVYFLEAVQDASRKNLGPTAKEGAAHRTAILSLIKKVDI